MRNLLQNVLGSTRWSYVAVMTIISLVVGMLWFGKALFGSLYMKWMHFSHEKGKNPGMLWPMVYEIISRILYFIGLWWVLVTWGKLDFASALPVALIFWLLYVVSTQLSQVARGTANKKVFWLLAGNVLVQTILGAWVFSAMIK